MSTSGDDKKKPSPDGKRLDGFNKFFITFSFFNLTGLN
ncbi:hypothetical protein ASZ90_006363 [hydrocarbon metagenome]|uniref:Uncharacterized protein n=1 Tax=hydrocarbon metagenome TaxID=938273 RepID=A0A0W8FSR0_9ZZZZ